jgi:hypothetical protein
MYSHKWAGALALVVLFALPSGAANAQRIGSATSVKPDASGTVAGTLSAGSGVHANETIKTGSAGHAGLGFNDQSKLHVGPSSSVRLDKFVHDPNKGTKTIVIDAAKGALRFSTGAQGQGNIQVKTPTGTLGIRG